MLREIRIDMAHGLRDQVTHDLMQFSNFCTPVISHFRKEKLLSREKRDEIGLNFSLENTFF